MGTLYAQNKDKIIESIKERNHKGLLPARRIETDKTYTQTRDLMTKLYPHSLQDEMRRLSDQEWVMAATGIYLDLKDRSDEVRPQYLNLFYLGDFLDGLEASIHLSRALHKSVQLGDGDATLAAIKKLRALPDYSDHFPNHPPSQGGKREKAPETRGNTAIPGGLQALGI